MNQLLTVERFDADIIIFLHDCKRPHPDANLKTVFLEKGNVFAQKRKFSVAFLACGQIRLDDQQNAVCIEPLHLAQKFLPSCTRNV